jgi:hypothetical protein
MLANRSRRATAAVLSIAALGTGTAVVTAPAQAGLLDGVPSITQTGETLGGLVPGAGGVVTEVTGAVGGVVSGVEGSVSGVVDQTLGGVVGGGGGPLPDSVVSSLLNTLLANSGAAPGTPGFGTSGDPIVLSGAQRGPGGILLDASAPNPKVRVLSKLKQVAKTGKMRIEIRMNEPGIVAIAGNIRPGAAVKKSRKGSRKLIKVPQVVLAYRKAGKLVVTMKLSRSARTALGRAKNAKMSVGTIAVDVFKNQDSDRKKLKIKR